MIYELKKILGISIIKYVIVALIILPIFTTLYFIFDFEGYTYSGNNIEVVSGFKAFNIVSEREKNSGVITYEKMNSALNFFKENSEDEHLYEKMEVKYPNYFNLIFGAYKSKVKSDEKDFLSYDPVKFYDKIKERQIERVEMLLNRKLELKEKNQYVKLSEKIKVPFENGTVSPWVISLKAMYVNYFILLFALLVFGSIIFSIDVDSEMEYLFDSFSKKGILKLKYRKLIMYNILIFCMFLVITVSSLIPVILNKFSGYNLNIQLLPNITSSLYNWSLCGAIFWYAFISYSIIFLVSNFILLLDYIFRNKYFTIIIGTVFLVGMYIINDLMKSNNLSTLYYLNPIFGINMIDVFLSLPYFIANIPVLFIVNVLISIVLLIIYFSLDYKKFHKE